MKDNVTEVQIFHARSIENAGLYERASEAGAQSKHDVATVRISAVMFRDRRCRSVVDNRGGKGEGLFEVFAEIISCKTRQS